MPTQKFTVNNGTFTYIARDQVNHNYPSGFSPSYAQSSNINHNTPTSQQNDRDPETTSSQSRPDGPQASTAQAPTPAPVPGFQHLVPPVAPPSQTSVHRPVPPNKSLLHQSPPPGREPQQYRSSVQGSAQGGAPYVPSPPTGALTDAPAFILSPAPSSIGPFETGAEVYTSQAIQTSSQASSYPPSAPLSQVPMSSVASTSPVEVYSQYYSYANYTPNAPPHVPEFQNSPFTYDPHPQHSQSTSTDTETRDPYVQCIYRQKQLRQLSHQVLWQEPQVEGHHSPNVNHRLPMQNFSDASYFHPEPVEDFRQAPPAAYSNAVHTHPMSSYGRATVPIIGGGGYDARAYPEGDTGYPPR